MAHSCGLGEKEQRTFNVVIQVCKSSRMSSLDASTESYRDQRIASMSLAMSRGLVVVLYLFTTLPSRSTRNFSKFHLASLSAICSK